MKTPEKIEQALDKKKKKKKKKRNIFSYFSKDMCSPLTYGISLEISPVLHEEIGRRKNKIFLFLIGVVGWCEGALHHWGVQLILAYSWARPAILVVGKGRGGMFLFLLFLHFHSCSSFFPVPLFHLLYSLFYLFSPFLWETTQNDPQGLTCR